jgi:hypothetical protein
MSLLNPESLGVSALKISPRTEKKAWLPSKLGKGFLELLERGAFLSLERTYWTLSATFLSFQSAEPRNRRAESSTTSDAAHGSESRSNEES